MLTQLSLQEDAGVGLETQGGSSTALSVKGSQRDYILWWLDSA